MALASDLRVPRFFTLGFNPKGYYLSFVGDGGEMDGCIRFFGTNVESPYTKFEAEAANVDGLFHIRSCQNNRYWERNKIPPWITATALKEEEDQSKPSCTLFKLVSVDAAMKTVRMVHVQSGNYLCLWGTSQPATDCCALASYNIYDHQGCDIFQLIDWSSFFILPRYVAFKGHNGKFLCLRYQGRNLPYMQFATDDIGDSTVPLEILVTSDGIVRIKPTCTDKFWRVSPNWIVRNHLLSPRL